MGRLLNCFVLSALKAGANPLTSHHTATGVTVMSQKAASGKRLIESDRVEGTAVYDQDARRVGAIKRLMIEKITGQVVYAVLSFGEAPAGSEQVHTIPWAKLKYDTSLGGYRTDIAESELRSAPRIPPYWRSL
jgi:hypothetical protein